MASWQHKFWKRDRQHIEQGSRTCKKCGGYQRVFLHHTDKCYVASHYEEAYERPDPKFAVKYCKCMYPHGSLQFSGTKLGESRDYVPCTTELEKYVIRQDD